VFSTGATPGTLLKELRLQHFPRSVDFRAASRQRRGMERREGAKGIEERKGRDMHLEKNLKVDACGSNK